MTSRHKFVARFNDEDDLQKYQGYEVDDGTTTKFYQLASFPYDNRYHLRRFVLNGKNEFVHIQNFYLSKRQYKKFLLKKKNYQYKLYPVYDLDVAGYPTSGDIQMAKSSILSQNNEYYGYSAF